MKGKLYGKYVDGRHEGVLEEYGKEGWIKIGTTIE